MSQWKHISIAKLTMTNFKCFYGKHQIDLLTEPDIDRNLILIGGDNGRGKTSIHEAINYVLYEDGDLPNIHTRPNYLKAVSDRLNRRALDEGHIDYSVAIDLIVSSGDADRHLYIERRWDVNVDSRSAMQPILLIEENGRPIDWIEDNPSAYQDFLRHVIPPRVAPFFLFDGERIQEFAEVEKEGRRMIEAIEDILHITVYKTLREDIRRHVIDYIEKNEVKRKDTKDYYKIMEDAERIEFELEDKRDELIEVKREIDEINREQRGIEDELRRIASPHASKRDELILEKQKMEEDIETAKQDIQDAFRALPILLSAKLYRDLYKTLQEEHNNILFSPNKIDYFKNQIDTIKKRVFLSPEPPPPVNVSLTKVQEDYYCNKFHIVTEEVFGLKSINNYHLLHDVSESERQSIIRRLVDVEQKGSLLKDALNRRERYINELREIEAKILSTSDDPYIDELIKNNNNIKERIGRLRQRKNTLIGEIQQLEANLAGRRKQIAERQKTREAANEAMKAVKLGRRSQEVLDDFIKRIGLQKLEVLKNYFDEMYRRLCKQEDPVREIHIDHETWQIILIGEKNRPLEKRVFSAGMKEMYALALLWALAKSSGRELPIIIDTPVARLDTTNRRTLFEKYLPFAGHQVIVLSTDTEVDVKWAERLSPYVSKQYRLDYDPKNDSSLIRPGYFF